MYDHPLGKEIFPNVQSKPPPVQLWTIPMCPIVGYQGEEISTSFSTSPQEAVERSEIALSSSMEVCSEHACVS